MYEMDNVSSSAQLASISDLTSNTFNLWLRSPCTITITSKLVTPRISVDLTTLPGWSSLSSGSHSITIVAKADGYRDSEPSAAVSVTKADTANFTLSITRGNKTGYSEYLYGWINTKVGDFGEQLSGTYENVHKVICYSGGGGPVQILSYTGQVTINGSAVQLNYDYYGTITIELSSDATFTYVASD